MSVFREYLSAIRRDLAQGDSTEHTHRPALKALLEKFGNGVVATNEPRRTQCGAPDFKISRAGVPLGHIETKDVGTDLAEIGRGRGPHADQFQRYKAGLPNWILTDYLDFHWFVSGQRRLTASLAGLKNGKLVPERDGESEVAQLIDAFLKQEAFTIGTARDLAQHMAHMTRLVRDQIVRAFDHEKDKGWLHTWLAAFREVLIPDLDEPKFADMFAQTLSYGLFAARVHTLNQRDFSRERAAFALPKTNPFLRKLFSEIAGVDMPETIEWAVNDLVDLLRHAAMHEILKDFGKAKGKEDPVVHFYETFLSAYDPKMRELRGVYYTPEPVVSYIVRSVDHLLKTRFNRPKGLADENTLILDPAVGTATFLYFVIQHIYEQFARQKGAWDDYVSRHLLNRIFGFELLMAPYAVAHLKLGMQLQETGYQFASDQRLGIYLTNTLEEAAKKSELLHASFISREAGDASRIKKDEDIFIVLGNPPYSGISANRGKWITGLIRDYREIDGKSLGEKKIWVKNDYAKFIRFGQWRIERTGAGILAFITDNSYLDSPTFRGMRFSLMKSFNEILILNLHGSVKRKEKSPDGTADKSVFDIRQGTAIGLFAKSSKNATCRVCYSELWGDRERKYQTLSSTSASSTKWQELKPVGPFFEFVPTGTTGVSDYENAWSVKGIFPVASNGIQTSRDALVIGFSEAELQRQLGHFADKDCADSEIRGEFFPSTSVAKYAPGDTREWNLSVARQRIASDENWSDEIRRYAYRPFDSRYIIYRDYMIDWPRRDVMGHLLDTNVALAVGRAGLVASGQWDIVFCINSICDHNLFYRGSSLNAPLYLSAGATDQRHLLSREPKKPNIASGFISEICDRLKLRFVENGSGDLRETVGPEDLLAYVYAVLFCPSYRKRHAEQLKIDFPRIPLTSDRELFAALVAKGADLVALHTMESPKLNEFITAFPEKGSNLVEKPRYTERDSRVWINPTQYFEGVPREVWEFHIGGYQVCEKWLKDREGRQLSYDDIQHYQKVVVALKETIRLMTEIDALIPGWPLP
jgi:predicted helicase